MDAVGVDRVTFKAMAKGAEAAAVVSTAAAGIAISISAIKAETAHHRPKSR